jgi:hypothetical protein
MANGGTNVGGICYQKQLFMHSIDPNKGDELEKRKLTIENS